jgi:hypothetical protein
VLWFLFSFIFCLRDVCYSPASRWHSNFLPPFLYTLLLSSDNCRWIVWAPRSIKVVAASFLVLRWKADGLYDHLDMCGGEQAVGVDREKLFCAMQLFKRFLLAAAERAGLHFRAGHHHGGGWLESPLRRSLSLTSSN